MRSNKIVVNSCRLADDLRARGIGKIYSQTFCRIFISECMRASQNVKNVQIITPFLTLSLSLLSSLSFSLLINSVWFYNVMCLCVG